MYEPVNEKIKVLAAFENGTITPKVFKWHNRDYKIKSISLRYDERRGVSVDHHFAVETESGGVFKISFNDKELIWKIVECWK